MPRPYTRIKVPYVDNAFSKGVRKYDDMRKFFEVISTKAFIIEEAYDIAQNAMLQLDKRMDVLNVENMDAKGLMRFRGLISGIRYEEKANSTRNGVASKSRQEGEAQAVEDPLKTKVKGRLAKIRLKFGKGPMRCRWRKGSNGAENNCDVSNGNMVRGNSVYLLNIDHVFQFYIS